MRQAIVAAVAMLILALVSLPVRERAPLPPALERLPSGSVVLRNGPDVEFVRIVGEGPPFWMSRTEVPVSLWLKQGRKLPPLPWTVLQADLPIANVSYNEARQFAHELGLDLPTHQQWRIAAGPSLWRYPWGHEEPTTDRCTFERAWEEGPRPVTSCVAGASPFGILNMSGNVFELCHGPRRTESLYAAHGTATVTAIVVGGAYCNDAEACDLSHFDEIPASVSTPTIGVRLVANESVAE